MISRPPPPRPLLNRDLKLIYASDLTWALGDGLVVYLLPYHLAKSLGAGAAEVGALYTASFLTAAATLLAGGLAADRYDRKKVILAGWLVWLPSPLLLSSAESWAQALAGMVLWGFWLSGPAYSAYVLSLARGERLATTFAALSSSWSIGYALSPAAGGALAEALGIRSVFYVAFALFVASFITVSFIGSQPPPRPSAPGQRLATLLRRGPVATLLAAFASISFTRSLFHQFVPIFLAEAYSYGSLHIGLFGSASFIGSASLGLAVGRLGDSFGRARALAVSCLLCCCSLALLASTGAPLAVATAALLLGASYATWPLVSAALGPLAPECARARWMSIPQALGMLSSFPAPYVGGLIYSASPRALFALSIASLLSISLVLLRRGEEGLAPGGHWLVNG